MLLPKRNQTVIFMQHCTVFVRDARLASVMQDSFHGLLYHLSEAIQKFNKTNVSGRSCRSVTSVEKVA